MKRRNSDETLRDLVRKAGTGDSSATRRLLAVATRSPSLEIYEALVEARTIMLALDLAASLARRLSGAAPTDSRKSGDDYDQIADAQAAVTARLEQSAFDAGGTEGLSEIRRSMTGVRERVKIKHMPWHRRPTRANPGDEARRRLWRRYQNWTERADPNDMELDRFLRSLERVGFFPNDVEADDVWFFFSEAGYRVGHRLEDALRSAWGESELRKRGLKVTWDYDEEGCSGCECGNLDCDCFAKRRHETLSALIEDENEEGVLASLSGICNPTQDYMRVVGGDLAVEALHELEVEPPDFSFGGGS